MTGDMAIRVFECIVAIRDYGRAGIVKGAEIRKKLLEEGFTEDEIREAANAYLRHS